MKANVLRERIDTGLREDLSTEQCKKLEAWSFALGLCEGQGLKVSNDMLEWIIKEINGEITTRDIKKYLDRKYQKL